jgi:type I restriction enzyme S subunit
MSNKPPATTLKPDGKPALTPKLRFREFQDAGEWERKSLSKVVHLVSGLHLSPDQYGKEGDVPYFTGPSDFTNNIQSITRWTKESTCVAVESDTLITVKGSGVGAIWNLTLASVAIGRQLMAIRATGSSSRFVYQFLLTKRTRFEDLASGNLIPGLSRGDILDLEAPFPTVSEQERIADCLCSVDELISAQTRKLDALETHKKGLMQQLFPCEGETEPLLRFPEFQDAGEWEDTRLGRLGELVSGLTYSPDDVRETGMLVLRSSNVQNSEITLDDCVYVDPDIKGANLSLPNDILICVRNGSAALIGKNALIPEGMPLCTHGAFMTVFRSKSAKFVFQLFQTAKYRKQVAGDLGATINSINGSQLVKYKFVVPKSAEQLKIADFLSSIDDLIAAQTQKLDALKTHKKGLMQQLFPSPAKVEA